MKAFLEKFRLREESESVAEVTASIQKGVVFAGTNLWVLVFAILIASLGLNVNSTAVIIGAMLVSPLMGPIIGLGFGLSTNDFVLVRKSLQNLLLATCISLTTSTIYFFLTPLNEAHSEILARTSPNVYDVLIAFFGGMAGMLAHSSRIKGNVLPGVAIATALMPPLCTAGYGLATFQFPYFFGALYLFFINAVFIALSTYLMSRILRFPIIHLADPVAEKRAHLMIWLVAVLTLLPSIYFAFDAVRKTQFNALANRFVDQAAVFPNDYLLTRKINAEKRSIQLTFGGSELQDSAIDRLRSRLPEFGLLNTSLEVRQGFAFLRDERLDELQDGFGRILQDREEELARAKQQIDSLESKDRDTRQILQELAIQIPSITTFGWADGQVSADSSLLPAAVALVGSTRKLTVKDTRKLESFLRVRTGKPDLKLVVTVQ
jgi:uncharacterized hydrophobic protein (TIGR00271 family)